MNKIYFIVLFLWVWGAKAYIPSGRMILDKVGDNALKAPLFVEQGVQITSANVSVSLKEQWLFENENTIRLIVRGDKELQDQILFQNTYVDGQRASTLSGSTQTSKSSRIPLEKIFFMKSTDHLMRFLIQQGIVGQEILSSQNFKKIPGNNGYQYQPESFLRLGRIGGKVAYVFGPLPRGENLSPGLWVEQDVFHIMKLRNLTGEELRLEKITTFSRGARWPKELSFTWGTPQATAQVQASTVRMADANHRAHFQKKMERRTPDFERHPGKYLIEEFYQRFR